MSKHQMTLMRSALALCSIAAMHATAAVPTFDGGILIEHPHPEYTESEGWTDSKFDGHSDGVKRVTTKAGAWAMWQPDIPKADEYRVYYWHCNGSGDFEIKHDGGTAKVPMKGGFVGWMSLGDYKFSKGKSGYVKHKTGEKGSKMDAVKFLPTSIAKSYKLPPYPAPDGKLPYLSPKGKGGNLILGGKPYFMIAAETHDKMTCSDKNIHGFDDLLDSNLRQGVNTLECPIAWNQIEPEEGNFTFDALDALIDKAKQRNMHLCVLWFGSYKNLASFYAPGWVHKKFPSKTKHKESNGKISDKALLPVGENTAVDADARAFVKLMERIKEKDPTHRVVLMVQVQNEMPAVISKETLAAHPAAQTAFDAPVPPAIIKLLEDAKNNKTKVSGYVMDAWKKNGFKTSGKWLDLFGDGFAHRIMGTWYFGLYTEKVAKAGKAVLPLPLYANSWVGESPCDERTMDIFHLAAPTIDAMGPDDGSSNDKWFRDWNLHLCPEGAGPERLWCLYANANALFGAVYWVTDPGYTGCDTTHALLAQMGPLICAKKNKNEMRGFMQSKPNLLKGAQWEEKLGNLNFTLTGTTDVAAWNGRTSDAVINSTIDGGDLGRGCGMVMKMAKGDYVITSHRVDVTLKGNGSPITVVSAENGSFNEGQWIKAGPAETTKDGDGIKLTFPTAKRQYGQIRVRLTGGNLD